MPLEIGPQHLRLAMLAGHWRGTSFTHPNPWSAGGKAEGEWVFRLDGSGFNLLHDYCETRDDGYVFEGHGILTIDPATSAPVWFWFDSYGFPPLTPSRGAWEGNTLTLLKITPRGEGRTIFRLDGEMLHHDVASKLTSETDFAAVSSGTFRRDV